MCGACGDQGVTSARSSAPGAERAEDDALIPQGMVIPPRSLVTGVPGRVATRTQRGRGRQQHAHAAVYRSCSTCTAPRQAETVPKPG